jgi:hypothetical protein
MAGECSREVSRVVVTDSDRERPNAGVELLAGNDGSRSKLDDRFRDSESVLVGPAAGDRRGSILVAPVPRIDVT